MRREGGGRGRRRRRAHRGGDGGGFSPAAASGCPTAQPASPAAPRAAWSWSRRRRRRDRGGRSGSLYLGPISPARDAGSLQRSGRRAGCTGPTAPPGPSWRAGGRGAPGTGWAPARAPLAGACLSRRLTAQVNSIGGRRRGLPGWTGAGGGGGRTWAPGPGLRSPTAPSAPPPDARSSRSGTSSARRAGAAGATAPPPSRPSRPAPRRPSSRPQRLVRPARAPSPGATSAAVAPPTVAQDLGPQAAFLADGCG